MKELYNRDYFESRTISNYGSYEDWPMFEARAKFLVKEFNPINALDIGCAKGYLVKHLQKLGVNAHGIDISDYAIAKGLSEGIMNLRSQDATEYIGSHYDLIVSFDFLEHVPEDKIDTLIAEMAKRADKQFHMITTDEYHFGGDKTHVCMHNKAWWLDKFKNTNAVIIHAGEQANLF